MKSTSWTTVGLSAILGLLAGLGCSSMIDSDPSKTSDRLKGRMRFKVDINSPLYTDAYHAAEMWAAATGCDITVTPDGDIPITLVDNADFPCPPPSGHGHVGGCSFYGPLYIVVNDAATPEQYAYVIMHEMGHELRGDNKHLDPTKYPNALMCPVIQKDASNPTITQDDIDFICKSGFPCK